MARLFVEVTSHSDTVGNVITETQKNKLNVTKVHIAEAVLSQIRIIALSAVHR